jgi:sugar phosphate isomerase/epimerase
VKLGIVADEIDRNIRAAVEAGAPLGLRRYEIRNLPSGRVPRCDPAELREVEEVMREAGAEVTAISPGLFKLAENAREFRAQMDEVYPRAAELAHRWSLPGLIVFGFHKPGATEANAAGISGSHPPREVVEWLAEAGERAGRDALVLMIEPEPICWAEDGRSTAALIRRAGSPHLKINYDPGNDAWLLNRDPIDDFDAAAPFIANVHIKDLRPLTRGAGNPEWVPAGEGMIDYRRHFARLREIGFSGSFSLEPHLDGKPETIRRCKEAAERAWAASESPAV